MSGPPAADLLDRAGALLTRSHLRELGLERRAIDQVFRQCPVVSIPGYSRPMIRVEDFLRFLADQTYAGCLRGAALEQRIADKLGVSDAYVRRALRLGRIVSETPENAPRNPPVQAESLATNGETGIRARPLETRRENAA